MSLVNTHVERDDLGGGRFSDTINVKRIAYMENGSPKRMTFDLGESGDTNYPVGVNNGDLYFRLDTAIAGKSPLMTFGKGQSRVAIALLDANNVKGVVNGQSVTFIEAWNNADLTLTYGGHILRKDILLRAGHPSTFAFRVDDHANFDPDTLRFGEDFYVAQPVLLSPDGLESVGLAWDVSSSGGKYILTCVLPVGDYAGWTLDPTLTLQPAAADGKDAKLDLAAPNFNHGIGPHFEVGDVGVYTLRAAIQFDLSTLPAAAIISAATLSLYCLIDYSSNARTFRVFRLKRAWVEGTRNNANDAPATGLTWQRYDTVNTWDTAGGFGVNDCEQTDIGTRDFTAAETLNTFKNFTLTPTTKTGLDLGNGWLIKADTENEDCYDFSSSDNGTAAQRPKLVVDYTVGIGGPTRPATVFRGAF